MCSRFLFACDDDTHMNAQCTYAVIKRLYAEKKTHFPYSTHSTYFLCVYTAYRRAKYRYVSCWWVVLISSLSHPPPTHTFTITILYRSICTQLSYSFGLFTLHVCFVKNTSLACLLAWLPTTRNTNWFDSCLWFLNIYAVLMMNFYIMEIV